MGIKNLLGNGREAEIDELTAEDIVIVPAFGTDLITLKKIQERGCRDARASLAAASFGCAGRGPRPVAARKVRRRALLAQELPLRDGWARIQHHEGDRFAGSHHLVTSL